MSMIITEKGNDEKIIEAKGYTPNKSTLHAATKTHWSHLFVYNTENGNGTDIYNSCKFNTFISAEFQEQHISEEGKKDVDRGWI